MEQVVGRDIPQDRIEILSCQPLPQTAPQPHLASPRLSPAGDRRTGPDLLLAACSQLAGYKFLLAPRLAAEPTASAPAVEAEECPESYVLLGRQVFRFR